MALSLAFAKKPAVDQTPAATALAEHREKLAIGQRQIEAEQQRADQRDAKAREIEQVRAEVKAQCELRDLYGRSIDLRDLQRKLIAAEGALSSLQPTAGMDDLLAEQRDLHAKTAYLLLAALHEKAAALAVPFREVEVPLLKLLLEVFATGLAHDTLAMELGTGQFLIGDQCGVYSDPFIARLSTKALPAFAHWSTDPGEAAQQRVDAAQAVEARSRGIVYELLNGEPTA